MESVHIQKRLGAKLPHWTKENAIYAVNFRLADSLPQEKLREVKMERDWIIKRAKDQRRPYTVEERRQLRFLQTEKVDDYLRNGYGACWLRRPEIAEIVINALKHFDGKRYRLFAWCIMPNHVHIVVQPLPGEELSKIVHSWKSFTANEANTLLKRTGAFWQVEYYDHLIRNPDQLHHAIEYAWENPDYAFLKDWKWRWKARVT